MKKYELTDETIKIGGHTLYRIKALVDFGNVKAGDIGGRIEKEENLAQDGNAWVSGDAWVSCDAHYLAIGPIGSRDDTVTFTRRKNGGIYGAVGCFLGTLDEFRKKVEETHGDNAHAEAYLLAAKLAEVRIDTTPIDDEVK